MTPKEQARMKILLLILFGVAIAVISYFMLNSNDTREPVPKQSKENSSVSQMEFEEDFAKRKIAQEKGVKKEEYEVVFEKKVAGQEVEDSVGDQEIYIKEFEEFLSYQ